MYIYIYIYILGYRGVCLPESLTQGLLVGKLLVGGLGVKVFSNHFTQSPFSTVFTSLLFIACRLALSRPDHQVLRCARLYMYVCVYIYICTYVMLLLILILLLLSLVLLLLLLLLLSLVVVVVVVVEVAAVVVVVVVVVVV